MPLTNCMNAKPQTPLDLTSGVRGLVDRQGALVERYAYDPYGLPLIREAEGRGDMFNANAIGTKINNTAMTDAVACTIWDPRADINDDGVINSTDTTAYNTKKASWPPSASPTVAQAFSDVDNPFMFQGVPHFALSSTLTDTVATLPLNHHRARFNDPVTGRWITRDPIGYVDGMNLYESSWSNPIDGYDPTGNSVGYWIVRAGTAFWKEVSRTKAIKEFDKGKNVRVISDRSKKEAYSAARKFARNSKDFKGKAILRHTKHDPPNPHLQPNPRGANKRNHLFYKCGTAAIALGAFAQQGAATVSAFSSDDSPCVQFATMLRRGSVDNTKCQDCANYIDETVGFGNGGLFSNGVCAVLPPNGEYGNGGPPAPNPPFPADPPPPEPLVQPPPPPPSPPGPSGPARPFDPPTRCGGFEAGDFPRPPGWPPNAPWPPK